MRFDSRSGGSAAQMFLSVLNAVTNKHPNGAIQHRQFRETGEPGLAMERGKIGVELDHLSLTVNTCPSLIHPIHGRRCLVNGNAPEGVAQVGGEIGERARVPAKKTTRLSPSIRETSPRGRPSDVPTVRCDRQ